MMVLRAFFGWCVNRRMIPRSPVLDVELVTLSPSPMKQFCSRELRDKLIDECTDPSLK